MTRLGIRNTSRQRQRSLMSVSLIAAATFVVVAVAAGRRNPAVEQPVRMSGNGGFRLVAQSTEPVLFDLNTDAGRRALGMTQLAAADRELLSSSSFVSFRVKPGEDASCLNVYQTRTPTILGVPDSMIERGGFRFIGARESNPWLRLRAAEADGSAPVLGDANTLQFSLHKGVGDTIALAEDSQSPALKVAGMLDGSVFQGVLLMSEANFQRLFPDRAGYEYFLVEVSKPAAERVTQLLETDLAPYGFDVERVADRLASFLAVQNTYLSTFQALGGLGLLLGTFGLAAVMVRNVLERRGEWALLRAVGFTRANLGWLIAAETTVLLGWGLACGTAAALVAMAPHLMSVGADMDWSSLALVLASIFATGLVAALIASIPITRAPIVASLHAE